MAEAGASCSSALGDFVCVVSMPSWRASTQPTELSFTFASSRKPSSPLSLLCPQSPFLAGAHAHVYAGFPVLGQALCLPARL